jgi:hypothetical protein
MTHRKITVCAFVTSSSPKAHEKRQHDWRPDFCKEKGCYGVLVDCECKQAIRIHNRKEIKDMLAYMRKLKREGLIQPKAKSN